MKGLALAASPLVLTRRILPRAARRWLNDRWFVRWARVQIRNRLVIRPTLKRQLAWSTQEPELWKRDLRAAKRGRNRVDRIDAGIGI